MKVVEKETGVCGTCRKEKRWSYEGEDQKMKNNLTLENKEKG